MTRHKRESKYGIFIEIKNTYFDYICESEALQFFKCCLQIEPKKI